ncbi:MAG: type II toxin-antitoxin system VapC family toxin [Betaproteobacteria bacterium]|nr:type II toxin-antitoxin system VapC family toxin [Betaproteobacteria bacterium]
MIVLDTHILVWWVSGSQPLSPTMQKAIETQLDEGRILISSISAWEIAVLIKHDRIALSMDIERWLLSVEQIEAVRFVPVDNEISIKSCQLPGEFHKDPADRIIVSTARQFAAPLLTADEKILAYPHVQTIR